MPAGRSAPSRSRSASAISPTSTAPSANTTWCRPPPCAPGHSFWRWNLHPEARPLPQLTHLRLRPLLPERHIHLAVHRRSRREVLLRLLTRARAPVELAEAEMAVGNKRPHAARLRERQRLAVVGLAALCVEAVGMGRDVAEQVKRMGRKPGVTLRGFDRAGAQPLRRVEPVELQTGTTERVVAPDALHQHSLLRRAR